MVDMLIGYGGYNIPDGGGTNPPTPPIPPVNSQTVNSIISLKSALQDDDLDEIILQNGTYICAPAANQSATSLWIGATYANRTRPINVRAETIGGVTLSGNGATYFGGLTFAEGAHSQTWNGFKFGNGTPTSTGVITYGGYVGLLAPHHITLRNIELLPTITSPKVDFLDHGIYISWAVGGPHDLLFDGLTVSGTGGVQSAFHFFHSNAANANAYNVVARNITVTAGTQQAIAIWDSTLNNILIENANITGCLRFAVRYELPGTNITLRDITSTASGVQGFYSSVQPNYPASGLPPTGLTVENCSFDP